MSHADCGHDPSDRPCGPLPSESWGRTERKMEITPDLLLQAYRSASSRWASGATIPSSIGWIPAARGPAARRLPPAASAGPTIRAGRFEVSADTAFADIVRACAEPRPGHPESWINAPIVELYTELHRRGHAHSVECRRRWQAGRRPLRRFGGGGFLRRKHVQPRTRRLEGGAGPSRGAADQGGFRLLDCQFMTEHLRSFGAIEIAARGVPRPAGGCDRPTGELSARAGRRRSLRHRTGQHPHVVDAMVERRQRRRRGEHPAGEQLLLGLAGLVVDDGEVGDRFRRRLRHVDQAVADGDRQRSERVGLADRRIEALACAPSPCRVPATRRPACPARRESAADWRCWDAAPPGRRLGWRWACAAAVPTPAANAATTSSARARSLLFGVGRLEPVDQLVQGGLDLVGIASHQNSILQRIGAEGFDFLDVLVQDFDLFEAGHRLAVGLPPHRRRLGMTRALITWTPCLRT